MPRRRNLSFNLITLLFEYLERKRQKNCADSRNKIVRLMPLLRGRNVVHPRYPAFATLNTLSRQKFPITKYDPYMHTLQSIGEAKNSSAGVLLSCKQKFLQH